jgi:hypothetical protein
MIISYKIVLNQSFCAWASVVGFNGTLLVCIERTMGPILSIRIQSRRDISYAVPSGSKLSNIVDRKAVRCTVFPWGIVDCVWLFSKARVNEEPQQRIGCTIKAATKSSGTINNALIRCNDELLDDGTNDEKASISVKHWSIRNTKYGTVTFVAILLWRCVKILETFRGR